MATEQVHHTIPTTLSFSDEDVANATKRDQLADGWYGFVISNPKRAVSKNGAFQISMQCIPLKDIDDADSRATPTIYNNLTLPKANKEIVGHKAPNTFGICQQFLRALDPQHPGFPRKIDGALMYRGETIELGQVADARKEATTVTLTKLGELWENPESLENEFFFAQVKTSGEYTNVKSITSELPNGVELVSPGSFRA